MNITLKRKLTYIFLLLSVPISLFLILRMTSSHSEHNSELTVENSPAFNKLNWSLVIPNYQEISKWKDYQYKNVKLKYPSGYLVNISQDIECSPYRQNTSICIKITDEGRLNSILLKVEYLEKSENFGGGLIDAQEDSFGKIISPESTNVVILRSNSINGLYEYFGKKNISLYFIKNLYPITKENEGFSFYGEWVIWLLKQRHGYTISYQLDPSIISNNGDLGTNEKIAVFDQIISTLNIDFNESPFSNQNHSE